MTRIGNIRDSKKSVRGTEANIKRVKNATGLQNSRSDDERKRRFMDLAQDELLRKIDDSGKDFLTSPSFERFELYQDLLREAIDRVVCGGLAISVEKAYAHDPKVFTVITRVNSGLLELAEEIRRSQLDTIRMGKIVEQLKGLIADLFG